MPLVKYFDDLDAVVARSSWDSDASYVRFIAGPPGGHNSRKVRKEIDSEVDIGASHDHPDAGHFTYFANGELFLIDDVGSSPIDRKLKYAFYHNTLVINGYGQQGECDNEDWETYGGRCRWMLPVADDKTAFIQKFESLPNYVYVVGNLSTAYDDRIGLKKFLRYFVFTKDFLIVLDDLETEHESSYDWRLNTKGEIDLKENEAVINKGQQKLFVKILSPSEFDADVSQVSKPIIEDYTQPENPVGFIDYSNALSVKKNAQKTKYLALFYTEDNTPSSIEKIEENGKIGVIVDGERFVFDLDELTLETCGNGVCEEREDYLNCLVDCGINDGMYCSVNEECEGGYCIHGICRSTSTYCRDGYCDLGENEQTCPEDCIVKEVEEIEKEEEKIEEEEVKEEVIEEEKRFKEEVKSCDGCYYRQKCLPIGTRVGTLYCQISGLMGRQVDDNAICSNKYECRSNFCFDGRCVEAGLWQKFLDWFGRLFG